MRDLTKKYEQALKDIAACPAEDCYDADDLARTMRQYAKDALGVYDEPKKWQPSRKLTMVGIILFNIAAWVTIIWLAGLMLGAWHA